MTSVLDQVADALGERAQRAVPLGPMTTYGVGGAAAVFVEVDEVATLDALRAALRDTTVPVLVVGRGSNLLVSDAGFDGVALRLGSGFAGIEWPSLRGDGGDGVGIVIVRAGAAVPLPVLARQVADAGWAGLAWAVGVPGSVGGAVRMNAGGHGSDMAAVVRRYRWVDLHSDDGGTDDLARLDYGYRSSSVGARPGGGGGPHLVVTPGSVEDEQAAVSDIVRWRRAHQPGGSNAGSVFTNPEGDSAGRLIEAAGLKGFRLGSAHVSEKHANFIQADKGGRADDVRALMEHVRGVVARQSGIELSTEVRLLGFGGWETGAVRDRPPDRPVTPPTTDQDPAGGSGVARIGAGSGVGERTGRGASDRPAHRLAAHRGHPGAGAPAAAASLLFGLVGTALLVGVWLLLQHTSLFSARAITVTGAVHETTAQVEQAAGLLGHRTRRCSTSTPARRPGGMIEALPWVSSASVTVHWPDGVRIVVHEESPPLGRHGAAQRGKWAADGELTGRGSLGRPHSRPAGLLTLAGPDVPTVAGGTLGAKDAAGLAVATTLPPSFVAQVTAVTVEPGGWVRLTMTTPIFVNIGTATQLPAKYEDVSASILAGATPLHSGDVIDVSVPDAPTVTGG